MGIGQPFEGSSGRFIAGSGILARLARRFARCHFFSVIERHVPNGATVLDFGCGGGDYWLAANYRVIGLELAKNSAKASSRVYRAALNGDVNRIPARSNSFDAAVSSFVLEHLPYDAAITSLSELNRILKPGGLLISLCDLECDHPLLARMRRLYPAGYREAFIEAPDHAGLRRQEEWARLLDDSGFGIVRWMLENRNPMLDHCPWCQLAVAPGFPPGVRFIGRAIYRVTRRRFAGLLWDTTATLLDDISRHVLPRSWAYRLLFVARKQ